MKKSNQWRSKVNAMQYITRLTGILCLTITTAFAADWPQYRGANQDGISTEKLNPVWPPEGPKLIWKVALGNGYSSFAVSGDKAFTMVSRENKDGKMRELCIALDAATGKEVWAADITLGNYAAQSDSYGEKGGNGACSTPTIKDGKVYVYSVDLKQPEKATPYWNKYLKIDSNSPTAVQIKNLMEQSGKRPAQSMK